jgi:type III restriction enzyme
VSSYEVPTPILNSAYAEPTSHWFIRPSLPAEQRPGRRPSIVYPPREGTHEWDLGGVLKPSMEYNPGYEMVLVNTIRQRVKAWRDQGYPGVTRTTLELLRWWRDSGRDRRFFPSSKRSRR